MAKYDFTAAMKEEDFSLKSTDLRIAIVGTVGVPGRYGGFETLAENLVRHHKRTHHDAALTVWCSGKDNAERPKHFENADLRYVGLSANGVQSIPYDVTSLWQAVRNGHDRVLLLGVSGAIALPLIRLISRARIITNVDGIEWKREKWGALARLYLRWAESIAAKSSHIVIADNEAIAEHLKQSYGVEAEVIAYGGDHAVNQSQSFASSECVDDLSDEYILALCRIEPENNVEMILEAASLSDQKFVFVGNWNHSDFSRAMRARFKEKPNIHLLNPVYDPGDLYSIRRRASAYIHGHSAGGTNPALVEMMHFGIPVIAYDCSFNRYATENEATYFDSVDTLLEILPNIDKIENGKKMKEIAQQKYTWSEVGRRYFEVLHQE